MTVHPGFGGQEFMADVLPKVRDLAAKREREKFHYHIEVDGGINIETARRSAEAGANVMVAGTSLFSQADMKGAIDRMRAAIT
jgi:ribulose-phosphate 3-epimerase